MLKLYLTLLENKPYTGKIREKLLTWDTDKFLYYNLNRVTVLHSPTLDSLTENLK